MRRKYERGGADAVGGILNHAGDADVVFGHHGGDASEDAGLIFYRETNVVTAANTLGRSEAAIGARGGRVVAHVVRAFAVTEQRDRIGDVADDGAGGSVLARAAAEPQRFVVVDAAQPLEAVSAAVANAIQSAVVTWTNAPAAQINAMSAKS